MKDTIECTECKCVMIEDVSQVGTDRKYIQCPYCQTHLENPFYEEEE